MKKVLFSMVGHVLLLLTSSHVMTSAGWAQRNNWRSPTDLIRPIKPLNVKPAKNPAASIPAYRVPQGTSSDPVAVYLMAGQSNLVGAAVLSEAEPAEISPFEAVQIWSDRQGFIPLVPGFNERYVYFGPEHSFGRQIVARQREQTYLITVGLGSTNLTEDWHPEGVNNWHDRLTSTVSVALAELTAQDIAYEIEGLVWMQGESDVWNATFAAAYEQNLTQLIADMRRRYGHDLTVAIGLIRGDLPARDPAPLPIVRAAQHAVAAADERVVLVETDALGEGDVVLRTDAVHYNAVGQLRLGAAFGEAFEAAPTDE